MSFIKLFNIFGKPVYFHWPIVFVFLYFALKHKGIDIALGAISYLLLLLVHEIGHAYYVNKLGYKLSYISIYPIHGSCHFLYDPNFPIHPLISAGGLIFQAALLVLWVAILGVLDVLGFDRYIYMLNPVTHAFVLLNVITLIINSLPMQGLDGHTLWPVLIRAFKSNKSKKSKNDKKQPYVKSSDESKVVSIKRRKTK
jgi:Zn-dependent protease